MGYLAYSFESLAPPDILYRHIEDEEHYLRHLEIIEKALGTTLPRDYQVLEKEEGRKVLIRQARFTHLYEFLPIGSGCLVKFRVEWGGILNLVLWGSRKKMLLSVVLTDLLACEHTALLLMDKSLRETKS
ncbi:MAG: hypothetical protein JRJ87_21935 [Deltaproteobacteria bacterium]|nr:hypothetical protein [Deltaproteobacteria bacterium]